MQRRASSSVVAAWRQLHRTHYALSRWLERNLAAAGVTPPQVLALQIIHEREGRITPTRLAQELGQEATGITGLLDRLERQGWVRRVPDPADRRSTRLELTEAGRATLDRAMPASLGYVVAAFAELDPEEVASLRATLAQIEARVT